jgi:hypothetical protein
VAKRHSHGGVPFAGGSLDGHMNAIFDERTQRWVGFLRCATLASVTPQDWPQGTEPNRVQCYTESDGPSFLDAAWSLPRPLGLNTSFGYQPDSHVAFRYANVWLAFTNTFNPSQRGSGTSSSGQ